jgi:PAS domain S-box-containing protein
MKDMNQDFLNKAHLAAIVTSADDAILSKTLEGVITSWNPGAERMFGYSPEEMIGQPILRLIPPERQTEEVEILSRLRAGKRIQHYETVRQKKDGTLIDVSLTISPIRDQSGDIIGASKIIRDISERKQTELSLKESQQRLREFAEDLERLVENRTFELVQSQQQLRALAAQLNLSEQKERQRLAGELHDYLGQMLALNRIKISVAQKHPMEASLARVLAEVQATTDKALAYTRSLVAQLSPPVLQEFGLAMALPWLAQQMLERDLVVSLQLKTQIPPIPEDQALLLFQSIRELLLNCIKHAQVPQAVVVLERKEEALYVTVADEGVGFEPSVMFSAKQTMETAHKYGLFSIRERMISLGGRFELQSSPGSGTVATLVFPITNTLTEMPASADAPSTKENGTKKAHRAKTPAISGGKIFLLVVDDHAMVRQGLCSLLDAYDDIHVVGEARNGKEAIELASQLKPDVILMDVTMPDIDGIEVTKRIKSDHPHVLIIGMSVHGAEQVQSAMSNAGASAFIHKEAAVDTLHQTILAVRQPAPKLE